jgi:signal transduction histidine kinase
MTEARVRRSWSYRTRVVGVLLATQFIVIVGFVAITLYVVGARGMGTLRDNLAASSAGYARTAGFVFISTLDADRQEFLEAATVSPNIDAAFLVSKDGAIAALSDETWRDRVAPMLAAQENAEAPSVVEDGRYWLFLQPVFAEATSCVDAFDAECPGDRELLGQVGIIGSKGLIYDFFARISALIFLGSVILLAAIYWSSQQMGRLLYGPLSALAVDTTTAAEEGYRRHLKSEGPEEVRQVAGAINFLIDKATENAETLERAVAEKTAEERAARRDAEEARAIAERVKEWRTSLMSVNTHELLTPLRILIGELERADDELRFLPEGHSREEIEGRLKRMRAPIRRIEEIVGQVNAAMRIEEGIVEIFYEVKDLSELATQLGAQYTEEARRRGNHLILDVGQEGPVRTDHRMVGAICSNLLSNACKFTRDGEIEMRIAVGSDMLRINCSDTGVGIPAERLSMIFEPMFQADMSPRRIADGLGLGLSIVKGYVDKLGGRIEVESREGVGSSFRVEIPVEAATPGEFASVTPPLGEVARAGQGEGRE